MFQNYPPLYNFMEDRKKGLRNEIKTSSRESLTGADFENALVAKYSLTPVEIQEDGITKEMLESHAKGRTLSFQIPYKGYDDLLKHKPSRFEHAHGEEIIDWPGSIIYQIQVKDKTVDQVQREWDEFKGRLRTNLNYIRSDVASFNASLPRYVADERQARLKELGAAEDLFEAIKV